MPSRSTWTVAKSGAPGGRIRLSLFRRAEIEAHRGAVDSAVALLDQAREGWLRTQVEAGGSPNVFAMELAVSPLLRTLHGDDRWRALIDGVATQLA